MRYTLSLVVTPKKVHCAVIPRGQSTSYPLTFDQDIKPHHAQLVMIDIGGKTFIYGLTGPKPDPELFQEIFQKWAERIGKEVTYKSLMTLTDNYQITRSEIKMWLSEHANLDNMSPMERARLVHQFAEERTSNANA